MKKFGNKCDYTESKNRELVKLFRAAVRNARIIDLDRIFAEVAASAASRFYISEERVLLLIRQYRESGQWSVRSLQRRQMLAEIERRVSRMMAADAALTLADAVAQVVNAPAPSFYLTPRTCRTLIYRTIQQSCHTPQQNPS